MTTRCFAVFEAAARYNNHLPHITGTHSLPSCYKLPLSLPNYMKICHFPRATTHYSELSHIRQMHRKLREYVASFQTMPQVTAHCRKLGTHTANIAKLLRASVSFATLP
jgi:hypothetical protein